MMSGTTEPKPVVTGVSSDEKYEFLWKIHNWNLIKDNPVLREHQQFVIKTGKELEVGSGLWSKWTVGIKNYSAEEYGIYCTLMDVTSTRSVRAGKMDVHFVAELRRSSYLQAPALWTDEHYKTVSVGQSIEVRQRWIPTLNWTDFLDPETNATSIYIKLTVLNPVTMTLEGDSEAQETKFRLACDGAAELSLTSLLKSNFCEPDLRIVCSDGKELKCHKDIVQKSPVFEKMLDPKSGFSESSTGIVNVKDVGSRSMELVLHYLYTGDLLSTWKDPEVIVEFSYAANKYGLSKILDYLDNTLAVSETEETTSVQHLLVLLDVAIQCGLKKAENRIRKELIRLAVSKLAECKSSTEVVEFFGGEK